MENLNNKNNIYKELLEVVLDGNKACLSSKFKNNQGNLVDLEKNILVQNTMNYEQKKALDLGIPCVYTNNDTSTVIEPFYPEERLIVLGGGHVALPVVEFAAKIGFSVVVVDDRLSFANTERFPLAKEVVCDSFEHALEKLKLKESDYVVIITRGHR